MIEYWTIALTAFIAAVSPGPDFVIIAKNALSHNRHNAIMASFGIGAGISIHATYCILGLAIVISQSLLLFSLIKYLGASYLIYLGIKSIFGKENHLKINTQKNIHRSGWLAFRDGFLTNLLNPKCTLFMLSIFTLVVKPHTPQLTQTIYGLEIIIIDTLWFVFLSYGLTTHTIKSRIEKVQHIVTKCMGWILIALGLVLAFETR